MIRPLNRAQMIYTIASDLQQAWEPGKLVPRSLGPEDREWRTARDLVVALSAIGLVSFECVEPPAQKTPEEVLQSMTVGGDFGCQQIQQIQKSDAARIIAKLKAAGYWLTPAVSLGGAEVAHKAAEAKLAAMTQAAAQPEPPPPKMATPAQVLSGIAIEGSTFFGSRTSDRDAERLVTILKGAGYEIVLRGGPGLGPKLEKRPVAFWIKHPILGPLFYVDEQKAMDKADADGLRYFGLYVRDGT